MCGEGVVVASCVGGEGAMVQVVGVVVVLEVVEPRFLEDVVKRRFFVLKAVKEVLPRGEVFIFPEFLC